jgi:hypothetical protein
VFGVEGLNTTQAVSVAALFWVMTLPLTRIDSILFFFYSLNYRTLIIRLTPTRASNRVAFRSISGKRLTPIVGPPIDSIKMTNTNREKERRCKRCLISGSAYSMDGCR